ncbi:MAG TPA: hypothetical protein VMY35_19640, partial [Phycisphaerae bacterium]|nr:hypothetical protein [Phycisphaerae bacterium]
MSTVQESFHTFAPGHPPRDNWNTFGAGAGSLAFEIGACFLGVYPYMSVPPEHNATAYNVLGTGSSSQYLRALVGMALDSTSHARLVCELRARVSDNTQSDASCYSLYISKGVSAPIVFSLVRREPLQTTVLKSVTLRSDMMKLAGSPWGMSAVFSVELRVVGDSLSVWLLSDLGRGRDEEILSVTDGGLTDGQYCGFRMGVTKGYVSYVRRALLIGGFACSSEPLLDNDCPEAQAILRVRGPFGPSGYLWPNYCDVPLYDADELTDPPIRIAGTDGETWCPVDRPVSEAWLPAEEGDSTVEHAERVATGAGARYLLPDAYGYRRGGELGTEKWCARLALRLAGFAGAFSVLNGDYVLNHTLLHDGAESLWETEHGFIRCQ